MRKLMLVFLMLFLPLQWTAALAADCCLRHDAQTPEHHQSAQAAHHDHSQHEHQGHADQKSDDGKQAKADCNMNCAGCHLHHCAAAVTEFSTGIAILLSATDNTPYLSSFTSSLPDNLFRPPLSSLA